MEVVLKAQILMTFRHQKHTRLAHMDFLKLLKNYTSTEATGMITDRSEKNGFLIIQRGATKGSLRASYTKKF